MFDKINIDIEHLPMNMQIYIGFLCAFSFDIDDHLTLMSTQQIQSTRL